MIVPDIAWYSAISAEREVSTRCPFATVERCPRYYQSLSLLGKVGSTPIPAKEDKRLLTRWEKSELWPRTDEYATSIVNDGYMFSNFCPETAYDRFGLFASNLSRYADEIDRDVAHQMLAKFAVPNDWRWGWQSATPMHFTDCPLYAILSHREVPNDAARDLDPWYRRPIGMVGIGIIISVLAAATLWSLAQSGIRLVP